MMLTVNRRFTLALSRRLARDGWSQAENDRVYGAGREGPWGSGENFEAHFVFAGKVDPQTGMFLNLTTVKEAVGGVIERRYDHRFLNLDTPPFDRLPPTNEHLARELFTDAASACANLPARLVACHLADSSGSGVTFYESGRVEREIRLAFSAARRTFSPNLSDQENDTYFGRAASPAGHGHSYRLRIVIGGMPDSDTGLIVAHEQSARALSALRDMLDHRHLNVEVPQLTGLPMTTECLARFVFHCLADGLPLARVTLHEMPEFFAGYDGQVFSLGLERSFSAAHCLRNPALSDEENRRIFGKCSNPNGHGHRYGVQATIAGPLDERTGTLYHLGRFEEALGGLLAEWDGRHLDLEVDEFRTQPSTGEHILGALWPRLDRRLEGRLVRLRLFETENNRFALRRAEGRP